MSSVISAEADALIYPLRERLVRERKRRGISQRAIADKCYVSNVYMNRVEKGHAMPSFDMLYAWCLALGYEPQIVLRKL